MKPRRAMLRSFIAAQYEEEPLSKTIEALAKYMGNASETTRLWAAMAPLLLPDLVEGIEALILRENAHHTRAFGGGLLTCVYNPLDIISDEGPIGWLDDTIVVGLGLLSLEEQGATQLTSILRAQCEAVSRLANELDPAYREAVNQFVQNLWDTTKTVSLPPRGSTDHGEPGEIEIDKVLIVRDKGKTVLDCDCSDPGILSLQPPPSLLSVGYELGPRRKSILVGKEQEKPTQPGLQVSDSLRSPPIQVSTFERFCVGLKTYRVLVTTQISPVKSQEGLFFRRNRAQEANDVAIQ